MVNRDGEAATIKADLLAEVRKIERMEKALRKLGHEKPANMLDTGLIYLRESALSIKPATPGGNEHG